MLDDPAIEWSDKHNTLGSYKMTHDIHDSEYSSPLETLSSRTKKQNANKRDLEVNKVIWWIGFTVTSCFMFFFLVAVYFNYWENAEEFDKIFLQNQKKIEVATHKKSKTLTD